MARRGLNLWARNDGTRANRSTANSTGKTNKNKPSSPGLLNMPPEIMNMIRKNLPVRNILSLKSTSRPVRNAVNLQRNPRALFERAEPSTILVDKAVNTLRIISNWCFDVYKRKRTPMLPRSLFQLLENTGQHAVCVQGSTVGGSCVHVRVLIDKRYYFSVVLKKVEATDVTRIIIHVDLVDRNERCAVEIASGVYTGNLFEMLLFIRDRVDVYQLPRDSRNGDFEVDFKNYTGQTFGSGQFPDRPMPTSNKSNDLVAANFMPVLLLMKHTLTTLFRLYPRKVDPGTLHIRTFKNNQTASRVADQVLKRFRESKPVANRPLKHQRPTADTVKHIKQWATELDTILTRSSNYSTQSGGSKYTLKMSEFLVLIVDLNFAAKKIPLRNNRKKTYTYREFCATVELQQTNSHHTPLCSVYILGTKDAPVRMSEIRSEISNREIHLTVVPTFLLKYQDQGLIRDIRTIQKIANILLIARILVERSSILRHPSSFNFGPHTAPQDITETVEKLVGIPYA